MKVLTAGALSLGLACVIAGQTVTSETKIPVAIPASSMKWLQVRPSQEISALWGDRASGPNGRFNRFAAGFKDRPHFHTSDLHSIVLSGTVILETAGGPSQDLGPGSYSFVPARTPHTHSCKAGVPCVIFVYQDGPSDSVSVEATK